MQKNDLLKSDATIYRILAIHDENALIIDCKKRNMPKWRNMTDFENYQSCTEEELAEQTDVELFDIGILDTATRKIMHNRYTIIAGILPFICDEKLRSLIISRTAEEHGICKQTDDDEQGGLRFEIDKSRISIRLTAPYSEERRKAASEHAKKQGIQDQLKH